MRPDTANADDPTDQEQDRNDERSGTSDEPKAKPSSRETEIDPSIEYRGVPNDGRIDAEDI